MFHFDRRCATAADIIIIYNLNFDKAPINHNHIDFDIDEHKKIHIIHSTANHILPTQNVVAFIHSFFSRGVTGRRKGFSVHFFLNAKFITFRRVVLSLTLGCPGCPFDRRDAPLRIPPI